MCCPWSSLGGGEKGVCYSKGFFCGGDKESVCVAPWFFFGGGGNKERCVCVLWGVCVAHLYFGGSKKIKVESLARARSSSLSSPSCWLAPSPTQRFPPALECPFYAQPGVHTLDPSLPPSIYLPESGPAPSFARRPPARAPRSRARSVPAPCPPRARSLSLSSSLSLARSLSPARLRRSRSLWLCPQLAQRRGRPRVGGCRGAPAPSMSRPRRLGPRAARGPTAVPGLNGNRHAGPEPGRNGTGGSSLPGLACRLAGDAFWVLPWAGRGVRGAHGAVPTRGVAQNSALGLGGIIGTPPSRNPPSQAWHGQVPAVWAWWWCWKFFGPVGGHGHWFQGGTAPGLAWKRRRKKRRGKGTGGSQELLGCAAFGSFHCFLSAAMFVCSLGGCPSHWHLTVFADGGRHVG